MHCWHLSPAEDRALQEPLRPQVFHTDQPGPANRLAGMYLDYDKISQTAGICRQHSNPGLLANRVRWLTADAMSTHGVINWTATVAFALGIWYHYLNIAPRHGRSGIHRKRVGPGVHTGVTVIGLTNTRTGRRIQRPIQKGDRMPLRDNDEQTSMVCSHSPAQALYVSPGRPHSPVTVNGRAGVDTSARNHPVLRTGHETLKLLFTNETLPITH